MRKMASTRMITWYGFSKKNPEWIWTCPCAQPASDVPSCRHTVCSSPDSRLITTLMDSPDDPWKTGKEAQLVYLARI